MEFEVSLDNEQQFWDEIQGIVSAPCTSEDLIDNALRSYLGLTTKYKDDYLASEFAVSRCLFKLFASNIFVAHADYVRRQIIYGLLQEDEPKTLHLIASFLLFDGRQHEGTLQVLNEEGAFPRLLELLQAQRKDEGDGGDGAGLHRVLMDLLYEMSRIQRVRIEDLVLVDDEFIMGLFEIIEDLSYDVNDPYHYPVIRVLLVLNEQFMISAHDPVDEPSPSNPLTNKVIKILSMHGNLYKTFGENIILLINREAETSLQLLTLKLLYLIFTTPSTYEYFYTNDLRVLVDILIRNLLDLPEEASALRHTYLRVLYPLLAYTQLRHPPHYKRDELLRMLSILVRGQFSDSESEYERILHFEDVDETTRRLVIRCATVDWLREAEAAAAITEEGGVPLSQPLSASSETLEPLEVSRVISRSTETSSSPDTASPHRTDSHSPTKTGDSHHKLLLAKRLGMNLGSATSSSLSVQEVAAQHEKPGVITPSRADAPATPAAAGGATSPTGYKPKPKVKPEPPKTRRWRGRRPTITEEEVDEEQPSQKHTHIETTESSAAAERRYSAGASSSLAPPPLRKDMNIARSASNPPPAVPPPRRSVHHHHSAHSGTGTPATTTTTTTTAAVAAASAPTAPAAPACTKPAQKPEPPKTRRWGRGKRAQSETGKAESLVKPVAGSGPAEASEKSHGDDGHEEGVVSVEEAVQNVSLHDDSKSGG